jgi:hypothetical protein
MTPAAKLDAVHKRLFWAWVALSVAAIFVTSSQHTLERAAKRMRELEEDKEVNEELLRRRTTQLDGALEELHAATTGSDLDPSLDSKGSEEDSSFDSQGSIQADQG